MRVDGDECRGSDAGVDSIPPETLAEASDDDIVGDGGETGVRDGRRMGDVVGRPESGQGMT